MQHEINYKIIRMQYHVAIMFQTASHIVPLTNSIDTSAVQIPPSPSSLLQRDTGTYAAPRAKTKPGDTIQIIPATLLRSGSSCPLSAPPRHGAYYL